MSRGEAMPLDPRFSGASPFGRTFEILVALVWEGEVAVWVTLATSPRIE